MPIRFSMGHIKRLLVYFNMQLLRKGGFIYGGLGKDGIWRTCKFDYHKDNDTLRPGTANSIAHSLKFKDVEEMKKFIDNNK
ncbi:hypothetical protein LL037_25240 (plasmid) [Clostridium estertheticum]|uniref:Uncharacterized protein n=1 Tax=Clostridium estertheticum TaxID=238834 RepID=A0AA47I802_9CLOT|nr:hypothetical protein [Clostridium estertheticum]MBU3157615.1 hypothetical protein [Clostridium estertheticum]MBU3201811.1 hypothetical protein [Clostridium estertheticum]WAG63232.1 hypothetical protein LL038_25165 [Clostridium estertheticum]WAG68204.1 hypothetical protein LL037_25240 [Clostridium estertheticum]